MKTLTVGLQNKPTHFHKIRISVSFAVVFSLFFFKKIISCDLEPHNFRIAMWNAVHRKLDKCVQCISYLIPADDLWLVHVIFIRANVYANCSVDNSLNNDFICQIFSISLSKSTSTQFSISSRFRCVSTSCAELYGVPDLRMPENTKFDAYIILLFWEGTIIMSLILF